LDGFNARNTLKDTKRWYLGTDTYNFSNDHIKYIIGGTHLNTTATFNSTTNILATNNTLANSTTTHNSFITCYTSNGFNEWVAAINGTDTDLITSVYVNGNNDIFISGSYMSSTLNFYNKGDVVSVKKSLTNSTASTTDIFVAKYNNIGNVVWVTRIGGALNDNAIIFPNNGGPVSVRTEDMTDNVIISGSYNSSTLSFYNSNATNSNVSLTNTNANTSIFIAKYDPDGMFIWARRIDGGFNDVSTSINLDTLNNIIISGVYYSNPLNFYDQSNNIVKFIPNTNNLSGAQGDSFIAKYNSNGNCLWVARIGNITQSSTEYAASTSIDSSNNIYVTGFGNIGPILFFDASNNVTAVSSLPGTSTNNDGFVVKYNPSGGFVWAARIAGSTNDVGLLVSVDSLNNVIIGVLFNSATLTLFNTGGSTAAKTITREVGLSGFGICLAKYNSNGTILWATRIQGVHTSVGCDMLTLDPSNNIIIGGSLTSTATRFYNADSNTFTNLTTSSGTFGFIAKYNENGIYQWATKIDNISELTSGSTMVIP
jgi:hypothetical protein